MNDYVQCAACGHVRLHHKDACAVEGCSCPGFADPGPGTQTCPSRMAQPGPWPHEAMLDRWDTPRWGPFYMATWPEPHPRPRTCSFCGGVHPDDAVALVEAGWEIEVTGKPHKRYLNPPGFGKYQAELIVAVRNQALDGFTTDMVLPVPPVKVYTYHFDTGQAGRFNAALEGRRSNG